MLPRALCPLLLLLPLASCDTRSPAEQEQAYMTARLAASTQSVSTQVGAGLRLGMRSAQVAQHLDSLSERDELVWQLSTGQLPMKVYPRFDDDRLVEVSLLLPGPGRNNTIEYLELVRGLEKTYGESYQNPLAAGMRSWFTGGTEVRFEATAGTGYCITYLDLHQVRTLGM